MKRFSKLRGVFAPALRREPVYIELRGRESLLCDGIGGVGGYDGVRLLLTVGEDLIEVTGAGLEIRRLGESKIAVDGRIDGIGFLRSDTSALR